MAISDGRYLGIVLTAAELKQSEQMNVSREVSPIGQSAANPRAQVLSRITAISWLS
jgi:hypothetical protein